MPHGLGLRCELVLIDQSRLRLRQRELHASHEESLARLPLEQLNGLPKIPAHELRVPVGRLQLAVGQLSFSACHMGTLRRAARPPECPGQIHEADAE